MSWLLSRGYPGTATLKLVGDRYALTHRQRVAVGRCACSDRERQRRRATMCSKEQLTGQLVLIDGYNVLTTVEAALSGGVILYARDGCRRDMASVHGTYRRVAETVAALRLIGEFFAETAIQGCRWYLDRPVSNSGRLCALIVDVSRQYGWAFEAETVTDPDSVLAQSEAVIVTADSGILDRCRHWFNLGCQLIPARVADAWIVDLAGESCSPANSVVSDPES